VRRNARPTPSSLSKGPDKPPQLLNQKKKEKKVGGLFEGSSGLVGKKTLEILS